MRGYACYSPKTDAPPGGLCLSAFAIVRRGDAVLAGKPAPHAKWKEWAPNFGVYDDATLVRQGALWRLPAAYLREGEGPEDTLGRVVREQLGAPRFEVRAREVRSFHDPSGSFPGQKLWDLCFVHEVAAEPAPLARQPWFSELRWARPDELRGDDFGSAIGDLAAAMGLARAE